MLFNNANVKSIANGAEQNIDIGHEKSLVLMDQHIWNHMKAFYFITHH